jgi:hypothetical protein
MDKAPELVVDASLWHDNDGSDGVIEVWRKPRLSVRRVLSDEERAFLMEPFRIIPLGSAADGECGDEGADILVPSPPGRRHGS